MNFTEMLWSAMRREMGEQPERRRRFFQAVAATLPPDVDSMPITDAIRLWVTIPETESDAVPLSRMR